METSRSSVGYPVSILACLILLLSSVSAQEVVVTNFPPGVGGSVDPIIFKPHQPQLKAIADTLHKYRHALAIITGGADGGKFRENNDAKNPGLALGRAHSLRNWMIQNFDLDSSRLIIQSQDAKGSGPQYRLASIRIAIPPEKTGVQEKPIASVETQPVPAQQTQMPAQPVKAADHFGLQLGGGVISSPFGGLPFLSCAITWRQCLYVEGVVGHTLWNRTFIFDTLQLDTKRRLAGCNLIVYPFERTRLGLLLGWMRVEEISREYYQYVRLSEGALIGLRAEPLSWLSISGAYYPSNELIALTHRAHSRNDRFVFSAMVHKLFGGTR